MTSYVIEFRDDTGEGFARPERQGLNRQRAQDVALAYCRTYPAHMVFIYAEEDKRDGFNQKTHLKRWATWTNTEVKIFGEGYRGRRDIPSTIMKKARGRSARAEFQIPTLIARRRRN